MVWGTAQGALGNRGGAITLSTQRATRSLLVGVLPPAAFALLLILWIFFDSVDFWEFDSLLVLSLYRERPPTRRPCPVVVRRM